MAQKTAHNLRRYAAFINWRRVHISDSGLTLLLSLIIGILTGIAAWLLRLIIAEVTIISKYASGSGGHTFLIILMPIAGIILAGLFGRYIIHADESNGVAQLLEKLKSRDYRLNSKTIYGSMIASGLTLGFGGTAGSEGPIAYAGAGIGSKIGRLLRVNPRMMRIMIGCGAAAGIAGIFKAPIGGALFTLEVLRVELTTVAVMGVFMASLASMLTAYCLSGCTLDIEVIEMGQFDNSTLLWTALLGIVCGLYSLYYTHTGGIAKRYLSSRRHVWLKWIISGLSIGVMVYLFPSMYGEGYGVLTNVINDNFNSLTSDGIMGDINAGRWTLPLACLGIMIFKGFGSSATNNGGGVAGDFAPTLFIGGILGLGFCCAIDNLGIAHLNGAHYAMIAMGASMAGIIRAPMMAIFLATEMVGGVEFLLPTAISSLISYSIVMICKRQTFYHSTPYSGARNKQASP